MEDENYEDFDKIVGQLRLHLGQITKPLRLYGQGAYVDSMIPELINLAHQYHLKLSGIDIPYYHEDLHW